MTRGRGRLSKSERVAFSRNRAVAGEPPGVGRHCWVLNSSDGHGVKRAGLLLEWRRTPADRWEGRVVYTAHLRSDFWAAVEEWMPADLLEPA